MRAIAGFIAFIISMVTASGRARDCEKESGRADCSAISTGGRKFATYFAALTGSIAWALAGHLQSRQLPNRCEAVRVTEGLTVDGQGSARPSNLAIFVTSNQASPNQATPLRLHVEEHPDEQLACTIPQIAPLCGAFE